MNILELREKRQNFINSLLINLNTSLICIKANYPGIEKRNLFTNYAVYSLYNEIKNSFNITEIYHEFDSEGLIFILASDDNAEDIKLNSIDIENNHPLGRLIDIDIYTDNHQISRDDFNFPKRKCYICDDAAVICSRSQKHKLEEIEVFYKRKVLDYILRYNQDRINLVEFVLLNELSRNISLGTVTFNTNGSHNDMDAYTFFSGIDSISKSLKNISNINTLEFNDLREFGLFCEKDMFKSTNNINTHKGIIFAFILILASVINSNSPNELESNISSLGIHSLKDFVDLSDSNGIKVYNKYMIKGARGEAAKGYKSAFNKYIPMFKSNYNLDDIFLNIALNTEDTNVIHRAGIEKYREYKYRLKKIIEKDYALNSLEDFCIKNRISSGGSCDMLSISLFLWIITENFNKFKEVIKCK